VTLAHVGGVPVEEALQPVLIILMLSGAWLGARWRGRSSESSRIDR
jgi:hypothetical protein